MSRLVKASDISRTLFYYYYQDIFDVLEDAFSSGMSQVIDECFEIENPKDSISYFIYAYVKQFPILKQILNTKYYPEMVELLAKLNRKYSEISLDHWAKNIPLTKEYREFVIELISYRLTSYFFKHCHDRNFRVEGISEQLFIMISKLIYDYRFSLVLSHFVNQAKHGIIVKIFKLLFSGQKWAVKFKKQGLNPWYERNLENIMMNMQNLFQEFLSLVNVRNIDLKSFLIPKIKLRWPEIISIRLKIDYAVSSM